MFLLNSDAFFKILQKVRSTPLQNLADRCQQAEMEVLKETVAGNGTQISNFLNIVKNEYGTCKQYVVTDLGIITKTLKIFLYFITLCLTLDSKIYICLYVEVEVAHCP
jgi:hypothetical protein